MQCFGVEYVNYLGLPFPVIKAFQYICKNAVTKGSVLGFASILKVILV